MAARDAYRLSYLSKGTRFISSPMSDRSWLYPQAGQAALPSWHTGAFCLPVSLRFSWDWPALSPGRMNPMDSGTAGFIGLVVAVPLTGFAAGAMVLGILLSLPNWRHWPLPVLSLMSVLLVAGTVADYGSVTRQNAAPVVYGAVSAGTSSIWFFRGLKR